MVERPEELSDPFLPLKVTIAAEHREVIEPIRDRTLADLRARIAEAVAQCREIVLAGDPVVGELDDVPEPLAAELRRWPDHDPERDAIRFSDRGGELAAFAWRLKILESAVGGEYPLARILDEADGDAAFAAG